MQTKEGLCAGSRGDAWPALSQGQQWQDGSPALQQCCWSQPRAVRVTAGKGLEWETGWIPSEGAAVGKSAVAVENGAFGGKCFLKRGNAEVWGFVSSGNLYGGVKGCPSQCGMETYIQ